MTYLGEFYEGGNVFYLWGDRTTLVSVLEHKLNNAKRIDNYKKILLLETEPFELQT